VNSAAQSTSLGTLIVAIAVQLDRCTSMSVINSDAAHRHLLGYVIKHSFSLRNPDTSHHMHGAWRPFGIRVFFLAGYLQFFITRVSHSSSADVTKFCFIYVTMVPLTNITMNAIWFTTCAPRNTAARDSHSEYSCRVCARQHWTHQTLNNWITFTSSWWAYAALKIRT